MDWRSAGCATSIPLTQKKKQDEPPNSNALYERMSRILVNDCGKNSCPKLNDQSQRLWSTTRVNNI